VDPALDDVAFFMPRQADFSAFETFGHDLSSGLPDTAGVHGAARDDVAYDKAGSREPYDTAARDDVAYDKAAYDPAAYDQVADAFDDLASFSSAAPQDLRGPSGDGGEGPGAPAPVDLDDEFSTDELPEDPAELAAARRRHPSHPDFVPNRTPIVTDHERTVARLEELAEARTALSDVRPGPLGTLDVYMFADGTTLCMTPGHRETAERLARALREGYVPFLLGGSGVSGAYSLTFSCGTAAGAGSPESGASTDPAPGTEHVYILADRVIASL
jgi:hypothetical protein